MTRPFGRLRSRLSNGISATSEKAFRAAASVGDAGVESIYGRRLGERVLYR
jgi:hypothetical protein